MTDKGDKEVSSGISSNLTTLIQSDSLGQLVDGGSEIGTEYLDSVVNELFQDKVLGEVPIIKTLIAGIKTWNGIANFMFIKKLIRFLFELKSIDAKTRESFLTQLDGNKRQEIVDQLAIVLERHDHLLKSAIQGRLFGGMIKGYLSQRDYFSLTHSVDQLDIMLAEALKKFYVSDSYHTLSTEEIYSLASLRLIGIDNSRIGLIGGGGPTYRRNRLGIMLVTIGLQTEIPSDYVEATIGKIEGEKLYESLSFKWL